MARMEFEPSARTRELVDALGAFMDERVLPAESVYDEQLRESGDPHFHPPVMEELKAEARERGLWNLFLPDAEYGAGLTNLSTRRSPRSRAAADIAPEAVNCMAPDTGNMEVLTQFGTRRAEGALAAAAARRRDPLRVRDDRARCSLLRRHEHAAAIDRDGDDYVHQRPQVVDHRRDPRAARSSS